MSEQLFRVEIEAVVQPDAAALIEELDAFQRPLYPAQSHHGIDLGALAQANVLFAVARNASGQPVACGAIVLQDDFCELKRMFTHPTFRGHGLASRILQLLEAEAKQRGSRCFYLETGYLQPDAIRLYERHGYRHRGPFGSYVDDPNSVYMEKSCL